MKQSENWIYGALWLILAWGGVNAFRYLPETLHMVAIIPIMVGFTMYYKGVHEKTK